MPVMMLMIVMVTVVVNGKSLQQLSTAGWGAGASPQRVLCAAEAV